MIFVFLYFCSLMLSCLWNGVLVISYEVTSHKKCKTREINEVKRPWNFDRSKLFWLFQMLQSINSRRHLYAEHVHERSTLCVFRIKKIHFVSPTNSEQISDYYFRTCFWKDAAKYMVWTLWYQELWRYATFYQARPIRAQSETISALQTITFHELSFFV